MKDFGTIELTDQPGTSSQFGSAFQVNVVFEVQARRMQEASFSGLMILDTVCQRTIDNGISYGQSIIFTQEVQVQTAPRVFSTEFAVCVHDRNRDCHILIGLRAYPSRPWITLNPIVVERPAGAPEARRPTVPTPGSGGSEFDHTPEINARCPEGYVE